VASNALPLAKLARRGGSGCWLLTSETSRATRRPPLVAAKLAFPAQ